MLRIGWFSTGRGEGSQGLLRFVYERLAAGAVDASIDFVFSNREPGEAEGSDRFFELAHSYGLPLFTHSSTKFRRRTGGRLAGRRDEYDAEVRLALSGCNPDICVLAGYMLIVGGEMCRSYPLLNLHPALPDGPAGTWQEVVWSLIRQRAEETGAMVHLATEEVDRGPVLSYVTVPITGGQFSGHWQGLEGQDIEAIRASQGEAFPLFQLIRREQYRREPHLLFETIRALSEGRIAVRDGAVLDSEGKALSTYAPKGVCLDRQVEASRAWEARREEG